METHISFEVIARYNRRKIPVACNYMDSLAIPILVLVGINGLVDKRICVEDDEGNYVDWGDSWSRKAWESKSVSIRSVEEGGTVFTEEDMKKLKEHTEISGTLLKSGLKVRKPILSKKTAVLVSEEEHNGNCLKDTFEKLIESPSSLMIMGVCSPRKHGVYSLYATQSFKSTKFDPRSILSKSYSVLSSSRGNKGLFAEFEDKKRGVISRLTLINNRAMLILHASRRGSGTNLPDNYIEEFTRVHPYLKKYINGNMTTLGEYSVQLKQGDRISKETGEYLSNILSQYPWEQLEAVLSQAYHDFSYLVIKNAAYIEDAIGVASFYLFVPNRLNLSLYDAIELRTSPDKYLTKVKVTKYTPEVNTYLEEYYEEQDDEEINEGIPEDIFEIDISKMRGAGLPGKWKLKSIKELAGEKFENDKYTRSCIVAKQPIVYESTKWMKDWLSKHPENNPNNKIEFINRDNKEIVIACPTGVCRTRNHGNVPSTEEQCQGMNGIYESFMLPFVRETNTGFCCSKNEKKERDSSLRIGNRKVLIRNTRGTIEVWNSLTQTLRRNGAFRRGTTSKYIGGILKELLPDKAFSIDHLMSASLCSDTQFLRKLYTNSFIKKDTEEKSVMASIKNMIQNLLFSDAYFLKDPYYAVLIGQFLNINCLLITPDKLIIPDFHRCGSRTLILVNNDSDRVVEPIIMSSKSMPQTPNAFDRTFFESDARILKMISKISKVNIMRKTPKSVTEAMSIIDERRNVSRKICLVFGADLGLYKIDSIWLSEPVKRGYEMSLIYQHLINKSLKYHTILDTKKGAFSPGSVFGNVGIVPHRKFPWSTSELVKIGNLVVYSKYYLLKKDGGYNPKLEEI